MAGTAQASDCTGAQPRFVESAPRDRFELMVGRDDLAQVTIDLRGFTGRPVFDTAAGGTGVEVFQPLRDEGGANVSDVADCAGVITVTLRDGQADARMEATVFDNRNRA